MKDKRRWLLIGILVAFFLMVVAMTWYFTGQNGQMSNAQSMYIAKNIENTMADHFVINKKDHFWRYNLNELVRKGAHFVEYILLGSILCILLSVLLRRIWLAMAISILVCPLYAYIDEYRQSFEPGRTPRWFDLKVDVTGAILGVVMATIVLLIFQYIHKIKTRINELEDRYGNQELSRSEEKVN